MAFESEQHSDAQALDEQFLSKLNAQKLSFAILSKRMPVLILLFLLLFALFEYFFWVRSSERPDRYSATARLVCYPRFTDASQVDVKLVVELFYRQSLRDAVAVRLGLTGLQKATLEGRLSATLMRNQNNLILVTAMDSTAEKACNLNNEVVNLLLQEFQKFRGLDLERKLELLQSQKDAWLKELAECDLELLKLLDPTTMATPEQELVNIRKMITDQLFLVSELNIKAGNEQARVQDINAKLEGLSPDIHNHIKTLNYYLSEEQRLSQELLRARQLYTDQNPKIKALLAELGTIKEQREAFIVEKNLTDLDPDLAKNSETYRLVRKNSEEALSVLQQRLKIAEGEMKINQHWAENLLNGLAIQGRLQSRKNSISSSLRKLEDDLTRYRTAVASIAQELVVIDIAHSAYLTNSVMFKHTVIAAGGAGFLVFNVAWVWVLLLFLRGKIESGEEFSLLASVENLGEFPDCRDKSSRQEQLQAFSHDIFYKLRELLPNETRVVFQALMQGSADTHNLDELLNINFALDGLRVFRIKCLTYENMAPRSGKENQSARTDWEDNLLGVEKLTGQHGQLCINNPNLLLPSEVEILTRDVETIKEHYDLIFLSRAEECTGNESFFNQIANFADCSILFFGYRRSPRWLLRNLGKIKEGISSQIGAILTGVKMK